MNQIRQSTGRSYRFTEWVLLCLYKLINFIVPWHKLPKWPGVLNLLALRIELRAKNLHDTDGPPSSDRPPGETFTPEDLYSRLSAGYYNDLGKPLMGCALRRFGRNVPRAFTIAPTAEQLLTPNPRVISERLLARREFQPATTLNLLAAAWIQFQVHDWVAHEQDENQFHEIPLPPGDPWPDPRMRVHRTRPDAVLCEMDKTAPAYRNRNSHWWDGSQIYGSTTEDTHKLRTRHEDGHLVLDGHYLLPMGPNGIPESGFTDNWWIGLEFLHTLFAREHNAICDRLRLENPHWLGEQIFDTARLVNTALMAKIHTVEWTPGILAHPALEIAMNANWWGLLGEKITKNLGRLSDSEVISGILGSETDHHGAPYCLTEEFGAVYRLHSLIPDEVTFYRATTGRLIKRLAFKQTAFENSRKVFGNDLGMADVGYSLGRNHPGALRLRNFPNFLRNLVIPTGDRLDLAAVDILRDRERGVPRYNQIRRLLHMPRVRTFEELSDDPGLARQIAEVYQNRIDDVDLLVGTLAEPLPRGFGFSDTIFRIFILMASRRLKSDRFFTTDWRPEVYTPSGMEWVKTNTMRDVLVRHFPELRAALRESKNAFAPWNDVSCHR